MTYGLDQEREAAILAVETELEGNGLSLVPLQPKDMEPYQTYPERFTQGWSFRWNCSDGIIRTLHLLLDKNFPYSGAKVAISDSADLVLKWPHIEKNGLLCVFPEVATVISADPIEMTNELLKDTSKLIEASIRGENKDDFLKEFLSYWAIFAKENIIVESLVSINAPSRQIYSCKTEKYILFTEDKSKGSTWLKRRGYKQPEQGFAFRPAIFCWLPRPLYPSEYPKDNVTLAQLLREHDPTGLEVLSKHLKEGGRKIDILIGTRTADGSCAVALSMDWPIIDVPGFRKGKIPFKMAVSMGLGNLSLTPLKVGRADATWIHGRDKSTNVDMLQKLTVAILGCGSLGAKVARSLSQAGVGNFILSDSDRLGWENISRHQLGARAVHVEKTTGLKHDLETDFPHIGSVETYPSFNMKSSELLNALKNADLIISLTGEWEVDNLLNTYQSITPDFPAVVYGWMEPFGHVTHAVTIHSDSGSCLQCGFSENGRFKNFVTIWPEGQEVVQIPACGGVFTPYGAVELARAEALVTETALQVLLGKLKRNIDRLWIGQRSDIQENGGNWNPGWIKKFENPSDGGFMREYEWSKGALCNICRQDENHASLPATI